MEKGVRGVYAITCTANGRQYVGSSADVRERWYRHRYRLRHGLHYIKAMQADWTGHGEAAFTFRVLAVTRDRTLRLAAEQAAIDRAMAAGLCYNRSATAEPARGYKLTDEQRAALSDALKGRKVSAETRRKIGDANRRNWAGRGVSPEVRERMAEMGRKGRGKPKSAGHRRKISDAQKGRPPTPQRRANMWSLLTEDQVREIKRRLGGGETGRSLALEFNVSPSTISLIKRGKNWAHVTV